MQTHETYRVLVIDNNPDMQIVFRKILAAENGLAGPSAQVEVEVQGGAAPARVTPRFEVDCTAQSEEGLALVTRARQVGRPYSVAFVEARLSSGWDGIETIARLWQADPALEVVLCTAFSDDSLREGLQQVWQTDQLLVLKKPFDNIEVEQLAVALSAKWRLVRQAQSYFDNLEALAMDATERPDQEAQLRQSQKLDSIGQLVGGIAHDFNNLLTVINCHASLLMGSQKSAPEGTNSLNEIVKAGKRASALTQQLMSFSRKQEFHPQEVDLNEVIHHITRMFRRILGEEVTLHTDFSPAMPAIKADLNMIEQVLFNLAVNAREAMPRGGQLRLKTSAVDMDSAAALQNPEAAPGRFVCLTFSDTGCGIAPENLGRIFEPFFTTKEPRRGTGLGLANVARIVKKHRGWITVQSSPGEGTTFQIFLPVSADGGGAPQTVPAEEPVIAGTGTLLVVEEEPTLLKFMQHILESHGYKVLPCSDARRALEIWGEHRKQIDLLVTDLVPAGGMAGTELARILQASKAGLRVLYTSSFSAERLAKEFPTSAPIQLVQKPFHAHKLAEMVFDSLKTSS